MNEHPNSTEQDTRDDAESCLAILYKVSKTFSFSSVQFLQQQMGIDFFSHLFSVSFYSVCTVTNYVPLFPTPLLTVRDKNSRDSAYLQLTVMTHSLQPNHRD